MDKFVDDVATPIPWMQNQARATRVGALSTAGQPLSLGVGDYTASTYDDATRGLALSEVDALAVSNATDQSVSGLLSSCL